MNVQNLLNEILAILHGVKDNPQKLGSILDFLIENIQPLTEFRTLSEVGTLSEVSKLQSPSI